MVFPIAAVVTAMLLSVIQLLPSWPRHVLQPLSGLFLLFIAASSGGLAVGVKSYSQQQAASFAREGIYRFIIEDRAPASQGGYRLFTRAARLEGSALRPVPGKTMVYVRTTGKTGTPIVGETFVAPARLQVIQGPQNPGEPDFRQIYARDGIYTSTFIHASTLSLDATGTGEALSNILYRQRSLMLQVLRRYIRDSTAAGLAEAILVGYRNDLSPELGQAYARTGVMHVIAISGLHLGLIFSILLYLFRVIPGSSRKPWLPLLVAVPAIWWFSLLTGASASVIRSAVMSSLPVLGVLLHRRTRTINVCCVSMLLLLAWNPYWLWDAGFQLSYAAVWGILLYQRPILRRLHLVHPAARWAWELVAVTMAAQVFTTPLVIYYFHQFPLLFLFANLVAVPLSNIILLGTMLVCLLFAFPEKASIAGEWTESLIRFLNNFILRIDMVPHSVLQHLHIDTLTMGLIFGLLILLHMCATRSARAWLAPALVMMTFLTFTLISRARLTSSQSGLCILQLREHTAILQLQGRSVRQFLLPSGTQAADRIPWVLAASRRHFRTRDYQSLVLAPAPVQVLRTGRRTIILVAGAYHAGLKDQLPPADLILLRANGGSSSLETWYRSTGCTQFVADGSNSLWKIQQWREEAKKLPLRLHSTPLQGAFLLD
jgi:competence protein ComEC